MVHGVTVALSLAGVFGQVLAAALIIVGLLAASGQRAPLRRLRFALAGSELWVAFLIAGASTAGSLFFTGFASFYPGEVGWYQRICMYPLSITTLLVALAGDRRAARYLLPFPLVGISLSSYAILLEDGVVSQPQSCVLSGPGGCVTKWINEFGYVTIPVLSITGWYWNPRPSFLALLHPIPKVARAAGASRRVWCSAPVSGSQCSRSSPLPSPPRPTRRLPARRQRGPSPAAGAPPGICRATQRSVKPCSSERFGAGPHPRGGRCDRPRRPPNLGELKLSYAQIVFTVTNGKTTSYARSDVSVQAHALKRRDRERRRVRLRGEHPPA